MYIKDWIYSYSFYFVIYKILNYLNNRKENNYVKYVNNLVRREEFNGVRQNNKNILFILRIFFNGGNLWINLK